MKIICPGCQNLQEYNQKKKSNPRPRTKCKKCSKWIEVNKDTIVLNDVSIRKKKEKKVDRPSHNISPQPPSINDSLIEMDDTQLIRHVCRMVIFDNNATFRDRLDAVSKLMTLKDKSGTLDVKTQEEKEVYEKFKLKPTQRLVELLKESSQTEP